MSKPDDILLWVVRGVVGGPAGEQDLCCVVEANSAVEAEYFGWRRGIHVVIVGRASEADVVIARNAKLFYRYTPSSRLRCLGRPVSYAQAICLILCALGTIVADLRAAHVPMHF